jgi:hypothetical protein
MEETKKEIVAAPGWSWGAFLFGAAFLVAIKQYKMLWWDLLWIVPLVNIIFGIVFATYLGVNGHKLAARSRHFENQHEYHGFMKATDHAGKVLFFAVVVLLVIGIALGFTATIGRFLFSFPFGRNYH